MTTMKREELTTHHGKAVSIIHGSEPATGLLDAHDVTKACLKNLVKNKANCDRADTSSVVYLTDHDIETMRLEGEALIRSDIAIADCSAPPPWAKA